MFDDYYANVPEPQRDGLRTFRESYPPKQTTVNGTDWTYHYFGTGDAVLLWLVGGIKVADISYDKYPLLANDMQILAPNYPALHTMSALADGLAGILDAEAIDVVSVLAGSFGGMLAQEFLRRHPQRVSKMILSTTTPPDAMQADKYRRQLDMFKDVDEATVREGAKMQMFGTIAPPAEKEAFYRAYLDELFSERLGKEDIVSTYNALIDYMGRDYNTDDVADWSGEMLILDSDNDATFGEATRQAMYRLYPNAERHTFTGAGHSPGTTQQDAYFRIVREFLTG